MTAEPKRQDERRILGRVETEPQYPSPFTVVGRLRSFRHAFAGLLFVLRSQHNAWLHGVVTVLALVLGVAVRLSADEWCLLVLAIAVVWVAEAFNTGLEVLADTVVPERHPTVKIAKDVAAGAVLLASLGALVIGCLLFVPRLAAVIARIVR